MIDYDFCAVALPPSVSAPKKWESRKPVSRMTSRWARLWPLTLLAATLVLSSLGATRELWGREVAALGSTEPAGDDVSSPSNPVSDQRGGELFAKLVQRNEDRTRRLRQYEGIRQYELRNAQGRLSARTVVRMEYRAPDTKTFVTVSEDGSKWIRGFIFNRLMKNEGEAAAGREKRDSSITPHNYAFRFLGEEDLDGYHCYQVQAMPKRQDKYLFEGQIWIDSHDFAVVKIVAHPAKNPSFWIKRVDWVRHYGKLGDFWLPLKDDTAIDVRIFGLKHLSIDYRDYVVNPGPSQSNLGDLDSRRGSSARSAPNSPKPRSPHGD